MRRGFLSSIDPDIVKEQILLDRAGFSPGIIDGRKGENTEHARHAFQKQNGLKIGDLDSDTEKKLTEVSGDRALQQYTIRTDDVKGPFVDHIPDNFEEMAKLDHLAYHGPKEELAEKFHMAQDLLTALNPDKDFSKAGTEITVAAVDPMSDEANGGSSRSSQQKPDTDKQAARVVIDKTQKEARVYNSDGDLIAFYPASPGSEWRPAPSGAYKVANVAIDPTYTVNPKYDWVKAG